MNWQTILVAGLLLLIVASIIVKQVQNRRKGKSSCGCGCAGCALSSECHKAKK